MLPGGDGVEGAAKQRDDDKVRDGSAAAALAAFSVFVDTTVCAIGPSMSRRAISNFCAIPTALFLLVIGILHDIVGLSGLRRAIERGEIAPRFGESHLVNWAFSGAAMSMLGILILLVLPGLRAGSRLAWVVATAIGIFVGLIGAAAYLWVPTRPQVLIFLVFGALLAAPLLIWKAEFSNA